MKELLKLLNEWQQSFYPGYEFTYKYSEESAREDLNKLSQLKLFIKRLVDNDKIRYEKVREQVAKEPMSIGRGLKYNILLMLLAISENPIEDLISYLK